MTTAVKNYASKSSCSSKEISAGIFSPNKEPSPQIFVVCLTLLMKHIWIFLFFKWTNKIDLDKNEISQTSALYSSSRNTNFLLSHDTRFHGICPEKSPREEVFVNSKWRRIRKGCKHERRGNLCLHRKVRQQNGWSFVSVVRVEDKMPQYFLLFAEYVSLNRTSATLTSNPRKEAPLVAKKMQTGSNFRVAHSAQTRRKQVALIVNTYLQRLYVYIHLTTDIHQHNTSSSRHVHPVEKRLLLSESY